MYGRSAALGQRGRKRIMKAFHKFNQFNPYENKSLGGMNIAEVGDRDVNNLSKPFKNS